MKKKDMKNLLSEELERMLYLTGHKRGVVISEQNPGELTGTNEKEGLLKKIFGRKRFSNPIAPSWDGKSSGLMDMSSLAKKVGGLVPISASNVLYEGGDEVVYGTPKDIYDIAIESRIGKNLPYSITITAETSGGTPDIYTTFEFIDKSFPYPDNIISPNLDKNPAAQNLFDFVVKTIVGNLEIGGLKSMEKITVQGAADSARPTKKVPEGYDKLDHDKVGCQKPYCGEKNNTKRNQFLADKRAELMIKKIKREVQAKTGIDITPLIKILPGKNFYKPNSDPSVREGYKSVLIEVTPGPDLTKPGQKWRIVSVKKITIPPTIKTGTLDFDGVILDVVDEIQEKTGYNMIKVANNELAKKLISEGKIPDFSETGKLNGKTSVQGSIEGNTVTIDGKSWGNLIKDERGEGNVNSVFKYVTEKPTVCAKYIDDTKILLLPFNALLLDPSQT